jgi:hypothetical protein
MKADHIVKPFGGLKFRLEARLDALKAVANTGSEKM